MNDTYQLDAVTLQQVDHIISTIPQAYVQFARQAWLTGDYAGIQYAPALEAMHSAKNERLA